MKMICLRQLTPSFLHRSVGPEVIASIQQNHAQKPMRRLCDEISLHGANFARIGSKINAPIRMVFGHGDACFSSVVFLQAAKHLSGNAQVTHLSDSVDEDFKVCKKHLLGFATDGLNLVGITIGVLVGTVTGIVGGLGWALVAKARGGKDFSTAFEKGQRTVSEASYAAVTATVGAATLVVDGATNYASGATQAVLAGSLGLVGCAVGLGVWATKKSCGFHAVASEA